jgi:hypothetical protein
MRGQYLDTLIPVALWVTSGYLSSLSDLGDRSEVSGKSRIVFRSFEANGGSI